MSFRTEYDAPWSELIRFETEAEEGLPIWMTDLFGVDLAFEALKSKADLGDLDAGLRLFEFATHCDDHGYQRTSITDVPSPTWTEAQRMSWARLAARSGSHLASMQLLMHAESLKGDEAHRASAAVDAVTALQVTSEHGWLESLVSLADVLDRGVLVPRDPCRAFAYFQVVVAASGSDWEALEQKVRLLRASLDLQEVARARDLQEALAQALRRNRRARQGG